MKNQTPKQEIIETVVNSFGNENFKVDPLMEKLEEIRKEMNDKGENTGSMIALMNALPIITKDAKKLY